MPTTTSSACGAEASTKMTCSTRLPTAWAYWCGKTSSLPAPPIPATRRFSPECAKRPPTTSVVCATTPAWPCGAETTRYTRECVIGDGARSMKTRKFGRRCSAATTKSSTSCCPKWSAVTMPADSTCTARPTKPTGADPKAGRLPTATTGEYGMAKSPSRVWTPRFPAS